MREGGDHVAVAVKLRRQPPLHREGTLRLREPERGRLRPERRQLDLARLLRRRRRRWRVLVFHVQFRGRRFIDVNTTASKKELTSTY